MIIEKRIRNKLQSVGKSSKYSLRKTDEDRGFYVDCDDVKIPFKAMFFESTNVKLGRILSISADSSLNCISKSLGLCQLPADVSCYGCDSEIQYCREDIINCKDSNLISGFILEECDPYLMAEYINEKYPERIIRFNKHGDFRNEKQLFNFLKITELLEELDSGVLWYGYTARDDLLEETGLDSDYWMNRSSVILNGSNRMYTNRYKGVREYTDGAIHCQGDCVNCGNCYTLIGKTIEVKYH